MCLESELFSPLLFMKISGLHFSRKMLNAHFLVQDFACKLCRASSLLLHVLSRNLVLLCSACALALPALQVLSGRCSASCSAWCSRATSSARTLMGQVRKRLKKPSAGRGTQE